MALLAFAGCDQPVPATDETVEPDDLDEIPAGEDTLQNTELGEGADVSEREQRRESAVERETSVR